MSVLDAALAYAAAGLYVGPLKHREKDPGSLLGRGWQTKTSRDPAVVRRWFPAGTKRGVFLHCGRSGLLVFDVDKPENLHPLVEFAVEECEPPWQNTRPAHPDRRHYLFATPAGRTLGNSTGTLGKGWGEVRGKNGVIVVAPSEHEEPDGAYTWGRYGPVPVLPAYLAAELPDALDAASAVTDAEVEAFLADHDDGDRRHHVLDHHVAVWHTKVEQGESRHASMTGHLAGALKEAAAGLYPARLVAERLKAAWLSRILEDGSGPDQSAARTPDEAETEWAGLLTWAVAQARAADPADTLARVEEFGSLANDDFAEPLEDVDDEPSGVLVRFARTSMAALMDPNRPEPEFVVRPMLEATRSASFVAPAGERKSLLAMGLALAVARGDEEFAGMEIPRARRVMYLDMENTEDDHRDRLTSFGVTPEDDLDRFILVSLPQMHPLDTRQGGKELVQVVQAYGLERGDLLVLDSYQRVTEGEEDSSDTTRAFYRYTAAPLKRLGLTVLRTDNTGKDRARGARGSAGKRDDVDVEYLLKWQATAGDSGFIEMVPGKKRQRHVPHHMAVEVVVDEETGRTEFRSDQPLPSARRAHECIATLDRLGLPGDAGERRAATALAAAGDDTPRAVVREAVRLRKQRGGDFGGG